VIFHVATFLWFTKQVHEQKLVGVNLYFNFDEYKHSHTLLK